MGRNCSYTIGRRWTGRQRGAGFAVHCNTGRVCAQLIEHETAGKANRRVSQRPNAKAQGAQEEEAGAVEPITSSSSTTAGGAGQSAVKHNAEMRQLPQEAPGSLKSLNGGEAVKRLEAGGFGRHPESPASLTEQVKVVQEVDRMASWKRHVENERVPHRRDCRVCIEAQAGQRHTVECSHAMSLDIAGPFRAREGMEALVAVITVPMRRSSGKLLVWVGEEDTEGWSRS